MASTPKLVHGNRNFGWIDIYLFDFHIAQLFSAAGGALGRGLLGRDTVEHQSLAGAASVGASALSILMPISDNEHEPTSSPRGELICFLGIGYSLCFSNTVPLICAAQTVQFFSADARFLAEHWTSQRLIACSHRRHGQDKTVLSCLVRVGGVNWLLQSLQCGNSVWIWAQCTVSMGPGNLLCRLPDRLN